MLAPNTSIFCRVIFNGNSVFPIGMPDGVSVLNSLADDLLAIKNEDSFVIEDEWQQIKTIAINNDAKKVNSDDR